MGLLHLLQIVGAGGEWVDIALGGGDAAMTVLRFRFAPAPVSHGTGGKLALTINLDHSVGVGHGARGAQEIPAVDVLFLCEGRES